MTLIENDYENYGNTLKLYMLQRCMSNIDMPVQYDHITSRY